MLLRYKFHLSLDLKYSFLTFMSAERNERREEPFTPALYSEIPRWFVMPFSEPTVLILFCGKNPPPHGPPSVAIYYTVNI